MNRTNNMNKARDMVLSLVFPRRCPICDRPVKPYGALACEECETGVRYVRGETCCRCGKPLNGSEALRSSEYCEDCARRRHDFDRGFSLFEYRSVSDSIYRFKYKGRREYAAWYGEKMAGELGDDLLRLNPDALVPIPIHRSKMRVRGYNQAGLLARELGSLLNVPVRDDLLVRDKKTSPLKDATPDERNNILRGAFKIGVNDVKLKTIIIIDDIYTTGATMDEASRTLRSRGVEKIYFATLSIGKGV